MKRLLKSISATCGTWESCAGAQPQAEALFSASQMNQGVRSKLWDHQSTFTPPMPWQNTILRADTARPSAHIHPRAAAPCWGTKKTRFLPTIPRVHALRQEGSYNFLFQRPVLLQSDPFLLTPVKFSGTKISSGRKLITT